MRSVVTVEGTFKDLNFDLNVIPLFNPLGLPREPLQVVHRFTVVPMDVTERWVVRRDIRGADVCTYPNCWQPSDPESEFWMHQMPGATVWPRHPHYFR